MTQLGTFQMTWMIANIIALILAVGWIVLYPRSSSETLPKDAPVAFTVAVLIGILLIYVFVLRAGESRKTLDSVVENLGEAVFTLAGPAYIAALGTFVAKYLRRRLPSRATFIGMAAIATAILLFGAWYARSR